MNARLPTKPQPSNLQVDAGGMTDIGRARDTNEDAFLIATLQRSLQVHQASPAARGWFRGEQAGTLLVVADGMGGQGGGDIASRTAIETVTNYLLNAMPWVSVQASSVQRDSRPTTSSMGLRDELSKAILAGDEGVRAEGAHVAEPENGDDADPGVGPASVCVRGARG